MDLTNNLLISEAIIYAAQLHKNQHRKNSGFPYVVHPIDVLNTLGQWGLTAGDVNTAIAAICHDVLEDCEVTQEQLSLKVGDKAAAIVSELTFKVNSDSEVSAHAQKSSYLESFKEKSVTALVIKIADRICNTIDFFTQDPVYAATYWGKANELLKIAESRLADVRKEYGDRFTLKMRENIIKVSLMVVPYTKNPR